MLILTVKQLLKSVVFYSTNNILHYNVNPIKRISTFFNNY